MGGMASAVSANQLARNPLHFSEMAGCMARSVNSASVGTARNELAALTATKPPRPVCPRNTPSPPPRALAVTPPAAESLSWFQNRVVIPCEPVQLAEVVNQPKTWAKKPIRGQPAPGDGSVPTGRGVAPLRPGADRPRRQGR